MAYAALEQCLADLERNGHLIRVTEEVDPYLEMAAIQLRIYAKNGPALLFEKVKGCRFRAASNIFGSMERSRFIFRDTLSAVQKVINLKNNPAAVLRKPLEGISAGWHALKAFPIEHRSARALFNEIRIADLPQIHHWPKDGGAFITLPQVYSEDIDRAGIANSNLGMYRIQLSGNEYRVNEEVGLHYQIHRGIGIHQEKSNRKGQPLKVSIFVGGPPAHTLAAVMPLPEGLSELKFAGLLGGRRFRYFYEDGYCLSADADFVITGEVFPLENKPEGPFGDHLGYYSLQHDFPVMRVHKVYAKKNAIWPFTVVGRPPQEDTSFGELIHEITGDALQVEIPGLKEVNAVDAAGVHPLLLAIGSERYTPFEPVRQPSELLTIANRILGTGQLSLAKFLWITSDEQPDLSTKNIRSFMKYVLERIDWKRDLHFYTNTSIDTLDYSGSGLNSGSKVVFAAHGGVLRSLGTEVESLGSDFLMQSVFEGVVAVQFHRFISYQTAKLEIEAFCSMLKSKGNLDRFPLFILCDDARFTAANLANFLWVTFTRSNPAADIYGVDSFYENKHWGCNGPLIIDARSKPHHAPPLESDENVLEKIERVFAKGGSLYGF